MLAKTVVTLTATVRSHKDRCCRNICSTVWSRNCPHNRHSSNCTWWRWLCTWPKNINFKKFTNKITSIIPATKIDHAVAWPNEWTVASSSSVQSPWLNHCQPYQACKLNPEDKKIPSSQSSLLLRVMRAARWISWRLVVIESKRPIPPYGIGRSCYVLETLSGKSENSGTAFLWAGMMSATISSNRSRSKVSSEINFSAMVSK